MEMWLDLATGFTGALTLVFLLRLIGKWLWTPTSLVAFHSPKGGCTEAVVRELNLARHEILVLAYSFTSKAIAEALVAAKLRGVTVEVILDKSNQTESYSELGDLLQHGLTPYIDSHHAIAHNKVMIIDRRTLVTGSFNFTNQAEHENAENLLIIKGQPTLVKQYRDNYALHKSHSQAATQPSEGGAVHAAVPHRKAA